MNKGFGLKELPKDDRDFQLGAVFWLPDPAELPESFILPKIIVKDQGNTDYCSAFASCTVSELQEDIELSPLYAFALSKSLSGDPESWGQNLRDAMKAHTVGAVSEAEAEYKIYTDLGNENVRYMEKWKKDYSEIKEKHKKKSYFKVGGLNDDFDDIRTAIWNFRDKNQAVEIGLVWKWRSSEKFLTKENERNGDFGHALAVIGWETIDGVPYLVVQNSWGKSAGENGYHYISREVINENVGRFGAFMLVDMDREEAQNIIDNNSKADDYWFIKMLRGIFLTIKAFFTRSNSPD